MRKWGHSKDRLGEGVEDRDNLGGSKRTEGLFLKVQEECLPPLAETEGAN
jgi:hypothetical protein